MLTNESEMRESLIRNARGFIETEHSPDNEKLQYGQLASIMSRNVISTKPRHSAGDSAAAADNDYGNMNSAAGRKVRFQLDGGESVDTSRPNDADGKTQDATDNSTVVSNNHQQHHKGDGGGTVKDADEHTAEFQHNHGNCQASDPEKPCTASSDENCVKSVTKLSTASATSSSTEAEAGRNRQVAGSSSKIRSSSLTRNHHSGSSASSIKKTHNFKKCHSKGSLFDNTGTSTNSDSPRSSGNSKTTANGATRTTKKKLPRQ